MSEPYEEWIEGQRVLRFPPGPRHEELCRRLHRRVAQAIENLPSTLLLKARTQIQVSSGNSICPDLALVTAVNQKLWLAAEVISSEDHHADTVDKKNLYQDLKLARLWIVDPRYDNLEVYHATSYGITLKQTLAGRDLLTEALLPGFQLAMHELFSGRPEGASGKFEF